MRRRAIALVFILSLVIYANSLGGSFIWDDQLFAAHNAAIRTFANFKYFFTDPATAALGELGRDVYRPVTTLSYAIDYHFWGDNPFGYHLTNVIFHALNAVLVFILLSLLFGGFVIAIVGGLIFASHPVQTEVVSWISGRSSVLFLFFWLLSLIFYIRSRNESRRIFYWASVIFFAISLFSKEMAITLPVILILRDFYFSKKAGYKKTAAGYVPYFAVLIFYLSARMFLLKQVGQFAGWGDPYSTFLTMSRVIIDYIALLCWPIRLCAVGYDIPFSKSFFEPRALFSICAISALAAAAWFTSRRHKTISFSIAFFFITLLPVLNIIPIKALKAERFLYLPSIGFAILVAYILSRLKKMSAIVLIALVLIGAYSVRTVIRNADWADEITIGRAAYAAYPACAWTITTLGENYLERGSYQEALKYLEKAIVYAKDYDLAHYLLGTCYMKLGRNEDAVRRFRKVLEINPDSSAAVYNSLGAAYASLKDYEKAEKEFRFVLKKDPAFSSARLNLGRIYEMKGDPAGALKEYSKIILYSAGSYERGVAYMRMGDLCSAARDVGKARIYYSKAIAEFGPGLEQLRDMVRAKLGKLGE